VGIQHVSANGSGPNVENADFDEQLSTEETLIHVLWVNSLALPQKPWEVIDGDRDLERPNAFAGAARDNISFVMTWGGRPS